MADNVYVSIPLIWFRRKKGIWAWHGWGVSLYNWGPNGTPWEPMGPHGAQWGPNYVKLRPRPCRIIRNLTNLGLDLIWTFQKNIAEVCALKQNPADRGPHGGDPWAPHGGGTHGSHGEPMRPHGFPWVPMGPEGPWCPPGPLKPLGPRFSFGALLARLL